MVRSKKLVRDNPPTVEEVRDYIIAQECWGVNAVEFVKFYTANDWRDTNNKPVKVWKLKVLYWQGLAERRGDKPLKCWCGRYAEYRGHDDTGQLYGRCADHKPIRKPVLPAAMTRNVLKSVEEPKDVNDRRNANMRALLASRARGRAEP